MTVATILQTKGSEVVSLSPDASIREAVALLAARRIGAMPVLGPDGAVLGMLSERDILYGLARDGAGLLEARVGDAMSAPAVTVASDTPLLSALALMTKRRIRHLPVVDGSSLAGLVSIGDLVKLRIDRIEAEAEAMREYIAGR
jgi:CBS domain-containing protein